jgi:hypothetical protein
MLRRLLLAVLAVIATPLALTAGSAQAATISPAPTTHVASVAKGGTLRVTVYPQGSMVTGRTSTLRQNGHRVYDGSPAPGLYQVKSVMPYRTKTTTERNVWVPDSNCADYSRGGYDGIGDGDYNDYNDDSPYDACA